MVETSKQGVVGSASALDETDRKILRLLQANGRLSIAALSDAVGLTPTPLRQRIEKLEQSGTIEGYSARINAAAVGRGTLAFVHVSLKEHTLAVHQAFLRHVVTLVDVIEVHHLAGEQDFLLKVNVRDIAAFEAFILHRLPTPSSGVGRISSTFVLSSARDRGPIPIDEPPTTIREGEMRR